MKNINRTGLALVATLTLLILVAVGCDGEAHERVVFARNMTAPAEGLTASTSGAAHEILVIQLPGLTLSSPENLIREQRLMTLRSKGFQRIEVRGNDGKMIWEKTLG